MTTPPHDHSIPIERMLEAIAGIWETVAGQSAEEIRSDWARMRAIERGFEIISEASRRLPDDPKETESAIPWRRIAEIGDAIRQDGEGVDAADLLRTVRDELPALEAALRRMLARLRQ